MITRRSFNGQIGLALAATGLGGISGARAASWANGLDRTFARTETEIGGRLGVALLDTADGGQAGHRAEERFPLCSTFKVLATGALLIQVDAGATRLSRRVRFAASDLVPYSPITKDRVGGDGMTLAEICAAAIQYSDNTAANLLLVQLGGPAALTRAVRAFGDPVTRLDRIEPDLNEALPGDLRDTTTPAAMAEDLRRLAFGTILSARSREQLIEWLKGSTTGGARLRAGLSKDWIVGDKTGSGDHGTANDVAVAWPPNRPPVLIAVYLTGTSAPPERCNAAIASVSRAVAAALHA